MKRIAKWINKRRNNESVTGRNDVNITGRNDRSTKGRNKERN